MNSFEILHAQRLPLLAFFFSPSSCSSTFGYMNLLSLHVLESSILFSFHHQALKSWYPWISLWLWHIALRALFFLSLEIMFTQFIVLSWILSLNPQNNACSPRLTSAIPQLENLKPNEALFTYITDSLLFNRSVMCDSVTPWTAACQGSLSFTISQSPFKLMSTELVMPSNHFIFCRSFSCLLTLVLKLSF